MKIWMATAAAATVMFAPLASAKVLIDIDGAVGYNFNSLNNGTLMEGDVDLTSDNISANEVGLNQEAENGLYAWAKVSVPIFPDVSVKYENLVSSGTNSGAFTQEIYGESYNVTGEFESELDMSYLDLSLTYGIPLPMASFDFGLNFRSLQGGFELDGIVNGQQQSVSAPFEVSGTPIIVPMAYLSGSFTLPMADVTLGGEIKTLPLGDTNLTDWQIKGTWFAPLPTNLLVKLGIEAGYRNYGLTIGDSTLGADTSEFATEVNYSGFFAGAALHF
ncbi:MAG TPA: TIGR04219 family outer membrane beta-barrel protein [Saccharospirillum sp.]|nr:TIGR04219 family outer membrane beta-barrel protein [Saccharospirillum sp.]